METWDIENELATVLLKVNRGAYITVQCPTGLKDEKGRPGFDTKQYSGRFENRVSNSGPQPVMQMFWIGDEFWAPARLADRWTSGNPPLARVLRQRTDAEAKGDKLAAAKRSRRPVPEAQTGEPINVPGAGVEAILED